MEWAIGVALLTPGAAVLCSPQKANAAGRTVLTYTWRRWLDPSRLRARHPSPTLPIVAPRSPAVPAARLPPLTPAELTATEVAATLRNRRQTTTQPPPPPPPGPVRISLRNARDRLVAVQRWSSASTESTRSPSHGGRLSLGVTAWVARGRCARASGVWCWSAR
ncbi:hypothetical protein GGX14DRAFT_558832 [Mycena pura]|uniref:Secreted protein n=1 Tax=Mycena pura TaxID=153505 RepID=A0AAD6YI00_9AGAR|nr:hypothetical protein GGX14DRAFT_558832 [Mycena pura]